MTCPKYDSDQGFFGDIKQLCKANFFNQKQVDETHAKKYCLTSETLLSNAKYIDCPFYIS